jgi:pyruvate/2-oxoglutarate/acetoin dehydrogenase E1 component
MSLLDSEGRNRVLREITLAEAKVEAMREIMETDDRACLMGYGFVGQALAEKLLSQFEEKYSERTFFDPPLAELAYTGAGIGAAITGLHPLVSIGTASFMFEAWPQILNEAACAHYVTNGETNVPIVIHVMHGIRGGGSVQHSQSPQAMLWNVPGLQIILPSTPEDAKGLLKSAHESENPTIYIDHTKLQNVKGEVPEDSNFTVPLGKAAIRKTGDQATVVATSFTTTLAMKAAEELQSKYSINAEVIDPRTIVPFDTETILNSVKKTGRLVIADETHLSCGVASEISATIAEEGYSYLKAPIKRVATMDVPVPFSHPLEEYIAPTVDKIVTAARSVVDYQK